MAGVVALDLPGGDAFVAALQEVWTRGDAVLPVDQRLPDPPRDLLFATLRPTSVIDATGEHRRDGDPTDDGDALVMSTSGTTGVPKGVVLTHGAVRASALATSARLGADADVHWLACIPLAHIGGLAVVARALVTGAGLTVHGGFDPAAVEAAARAGATHVSLVPTAMRRIDTTLFRCIVVGGSRPPEDRPPNSVTTYGLTETGSGVVYDGVPLDGVEVDIAPDGEVLLRGAMMLRCYRDGATPIDSDGWLHTGDIGGWRDDGRVHVAGRRGDMIVTGGENVWPDAVERVLASHPAVVDVAVAGVPDVEWGARVVAWVVPGPRPPTLDDLRAHVRAALPAFAAPRELRFVADLPRTALGKVRRQDLP